MVVLERELSRFTRMLPGMEDFIYGEMLDRFGLFFQERVMLRGELKEI